MANHAGVGCKVRQSSLGPDHWLFDFDGAAPGGGGGASVYLDPARAWASIDGVHKNVLLPKRSTGRLLADGLAQVGMAQPAVVEAYNVERTTRVVLAAGGDGKGTVIGNMLEDTVTALGGTVLRWVPVHDGNAFHLQVWITYP